MRAYYAAISPDGTLLGLEEDAEAATRLVKRTVGGPVSVQYLPEEDPQANPPPSASEMPELAERMAQIPRISYDAVHRMNAKQAHELLLPFFAGIELRGGEVKKYRTPSGMANAWIGQNYKTQKPSQDPGRPAEVMGLTLVPASHARLAALGRGPYERLFEPSEDYDDESTKKLAKTKVKMLARWREPGIGIRTDIKPTFTLCQGSSKECRDSCLIFAGQNAADRYNTYRKVAQTYALMNQPVAFMRMLIDSIDAWISDCTFYRRPHRNMEVTPMFRLNVLSDIPWERIVPWLFTYYADKSGENGKPIRFYDYTKVPGRRGGKFPANYDLTFSLSGTDINKAYALEEIERFDSRIAAVLLAYKREDGRWETFTPKKDSETVQGMIPLPKRFRIGDYNLPVIDGDLSDARPNDRPPNKACVGLRWKLPSGKRSGAEELKYEEVEIGGQTVSMAKLSFVTPIYINGSKESRYEPNPDDDGVTLISAVTPRHQSIIHGLTQAG